MSQTPTNLTELLVQDKIILTNFFFLSFNLLNYYFIYFLSEIPLYPQFSMKPRDLTCGSYEVGVALNGVVIRSIGSKDYNSQCIPFSRMLPPADRKANGGVNWTFTGSTSDDIIVINQLITQYLFLYVYMYIFSERGRGIKGV